jgi:hypothetical protein
MGTKKIGLCEVINVLAVVVVVGNLENGRKDFCGLF